jgi:hypothetical protein
MSTEGKAMTDQDEKVETMITALRALAPKQPERIPGWAGSVLARADNRDIHGRRREVLFYELGRRLVNGVNPIFSPIEQTSSIEACRLLAVEVAKVLDRDRAVEESWDQEGISAVASLMPAWVTDWNQDVVDVQRAMTSGDGEVRRRIHDAMVGALRATQQPSEEQEKGTER